MIGGGRSVFTGEGKIISGLEGRVRWTPDLLDICESDAFHLESTSKNPRDPRLQDVVCFRSVFARQHVAGRARAV